MKKIIAELVGYIFKALVGYLVIFQFFNLIGRSYMFMEGGCG